MGKSRLTADERRLQIIEKAAEVFSVSGIDGTRTRDIADACNINEALLYRHFPSKDELYREAMMYSYDNAVRGFMDLADKQPNGLMALNTLMKTQLELLTANPVLCGNMWHGVASATHDPVMQDLVRGRFDNYHSYVRNLILKGQEDGSVKPGVEPDRATWVIRGITWCFILRTILNIQASDSSCTPEPFCRLLVEQLAEDPDAFQCV